ncbi:MAG: hypothetical protein WC356_04045 [Candidatus Micrarchaeia archaeon]|jgi:hypothetical protein
MKGLMSFEAIFSLTILIFFISSLSLLNTKYIDTTLYEYQLLNDILEVTEKNGGMERLSNGDINVIYEMQDLAKSQGYCLDIKTELESRSLNDLILGIEIINQDINLGSYSSCYKKGNVISTKRTIPTYLGGIIILEVEMQKQ